MNQHVLYVGPDYRNHRGGIGAVLAVYAKYITPFKFISTYSHGSFLRKSLIYLKAIALLIAKLATDGDIRIVHIHVASRGSFARKSLLVMISRLFGKKVIFHVHGAEFHIFYDKAGIFRSYIRFIIRRCNVIACLSGQWKTYFESAFPGKKVIVVNNVIEPPSPTGVRADHSEKIKFLFLGYIGKRKGIFGLIETLRNKQNGFAGRYTLTVGGNGEVEQLKEVIGDNNGGDVQYAGWVTGEKKNELLRACDVYVLPSYNEGLPISILEAMSYGKPIISTTVGGIPEIVKPGLNGWLFEPGDHSALSSIISEAITNRKLLDEYGLRSYDLAKNYSPESVMKHLNTIYKSLLDDPGKTS